MKANELMIGDWVLYNPNVFIEDEYEPTKACYPTKISSGEDLDLAVEGCYAPIPLTQEILEKNGLEKDNHGRLNSEYFDEDINQDLEITVDSKTGEVWWSYNLDEYYIIRLRYVHQLQHALRLCGIEKEIVI